MSRSFQTRLHVVAFMLSAVLAGVVGGCPAREQSHFERGGVQWEGRQRTYGLYVPSAALSQPTTPRAVVLAFHGGGGDGESMRRLTGFDEIAESDGFFVCYPDGVGGNWHDGRPGINEDIDDVGFVRALLDELASKHAIDAQRVYATGMSNGGHLCYRLAFDLSDRITAIAPVAALLSESLFVRAAPPPRALPVEIIVGDADPISPFGGGVVGGDLLDRGVTLSADDTIAFWRNVCRAPNDPVIINQDDEPADRTSVVRASYAPATGGAEFVFITIRDGGHTWPGGRQYLPESLIGVTSREFSAAADIWDFFSRQLRN